MTIPARHAETPFRSVDELVRMKRRVASASARPPVDIILLTYNRRDYFERTIGALVGNTRYPYRLIVVDNASDAEMQHYLQETAELYDHLILNEENYHTAAFQRGICLAQSDPYIVSDPDILVPLLDGACWLERLLALHESHPEMGLIALNLDPANKPAKLPDVYIGDKTPLDDEITLCNVGTVMQAIKRCYFDGCYLTDWETCAQVRANGGMVGFANNLVAWHLGWDEDRDYPDYLVQKFSYFRQKYGAETYRMYTEKQELLARMGDASASPEGYYQFARPEVQQLVNPASRRILDIGCGAGMLGHGLKQKLDAEVWGVEYSPAAAEQAKGRLDRVLAGAIEEVLPRLPDGYFDTIILADVLEHLVEPGEVLRALHAKLAGGGEIVASIPNVRHWGVLRQLLEGRWEYADAGILDRTHLRFFTYVECRRLFEAAGYDVKRSEAVQLKDDEIIPAGVVETLLKAGLKVETLSEESRHYQYLFVASPSASSPIAPKHALTATGSGDDDHRSMPPGLTSIVILTWNQLPFTQACLASISEHTPEPYELIMIDNGSTDGTVAWLRGQAAADSRITIIENSTNKGFAAGCNQGISAARGENILLLNNDTVVTPEWLSGMRELLERSPDTGIVGPMTNSASGAQVVADAGYGSLEELPAWAAAFRSGHRHRIIRQRRIVGFCMLFRHELVETVGLLDESFGSGNYEDDDFCLRAELAGYRNLVAGDVFIHHEGGATFSGNRLDRGGENRKNRRLFKRKWEPSRLEESLLRRWLVLNAVEEAEKRARRGEVDDAVTTLLDRGIKVDPNTPFPYLVLAEILMATGRHGDALEVLREMPAGTNPILKSEIEALCHAAMGNDEAAAQAALRSEDRSRSLVVRATLAAREGELVYAESLFQRAVEVDPTCGAGWLSLGMLLWGQQKQDDAWQAVCRAVMVDPLNDEAVRLLMNMAVRLRRISEAVQLVGEAAHAYPDSRNLAWTRAELLVEDGRVGEALDACESFLTQFGVDDDLLAMALELRKGSGAYDRLSDADMDEAVSLCMIVRNEEKNLARCLASVSPVVHEMVVVDTGSTDRTRDIAEVFGARVCDFPWSGDFSAARNASLARARAPWVLVMDADEVISQRDHDLFRETVRRSGGRSVAWSVITRNYTNRAESEGWHANDGDYPEEEQADGWYPSGKVRLFPRLERVGFRGEIHEMVEADLRACGIPIERAEFVVHHYGEITEGDRREKQLRYYELGRKKLAERPDDTAAMVELAVQAGELGLFNEALELWDRLLAVGRISHDALFNRSYALMGLGRFGEASEAARKALEIDPHHKESAYNYGISLLCLAMPEKAMDTVVRMSSEHPENPLFMALLCVLYCCTGECVAAAPIYEELLRRNYAIDEYIRGRVATLDELGHRALAQRLREAASGLGGSTE